ncbi:MAG: hypothetical protein GY802_11370 [Gammaproteobacteria bacterium]|nr:hypothetical protein [Gammaproteobacteria bacterium]
MPIDVLRLARIDPTALRESLAGFGLKLQFCPTAEPIPGSYWGDEEAGLMADRLYARDDTPLHSILCETSHFICMDAARRQNLDTDAGSDDAEENAVCYLQILLAGELVCLGREQMFADMDTWGYSFRLGSSRSWFEQDAEDALAWLIAQELIDNRHRPRYRLRN